MNVALRRLSQPPGIGQNNGAKEPFGILIIQCLEDVYQTFGETLILVLLTVGGDQGSCKQQNTQVGIASDSRSCGGYGLIDSLAHAQ